MRKKKKPYLLSVLFGLCFFVAFKSFSQKMNVYPHGTYIISAITKDGIIVGSDSRVSMFEGTEQHSRIYAHIDGVQKIFVYKKIFFQMDGQEDFSYYTIFGLFDKFKKENKETVSVKNFYNKFLSFAKKALSENDLKAINDNHIIISGYDKTKPCIYIYENGKSDSAIGHGFKTNVYIDNRNKQMADYFNKCDINSGLSFINKFLTIISKSQPKIGGKSSLGYLLNNGDLKTFFQKKYNYTTKREELLDCYNDKIKIIYESKSDSANYKYSLSLILFPKSR